MKKERKKRSNCGKSVRTHNHSKQRSHNEKKIFGWLVNPIIIGWIWCVACKAASMNSCTQKNNPPQSRSHNRFRTSRICHDLDPHEPQSHTKRKLAEVAFVWSQLNQNKNGSHLPSSWRWSANGARVCVCVHVSRPKSNRFGSTFDIKCLVVRVICAPINSMTNKCRCTQTKSVLYLCRRSLPWSIGLNATQPRTHTFFKWRRKIEYQRHRD